MTKLLKSGSSATLTGEEPDFLLFQQYFGHADDGCDGQQQVDEFANPCFRQVRKKGIAEQDAEGEARQEVEVLGQHVGDGHTAKRVGDERRDIAEKEKDEAARPQDFGGDFRVGEVQEDGGGHSCPW